MCQIKRKNSIKIVLNTSKTYYEESHYFGGVQRPEFRLRMDFNETYFYGNPLPKIIKGIFNE